MIPALTRGVLPPGVHPGDWKEVESMFGTTPWRLWLMEGLRAAARELARWGCEVVYLDGSFITSKPIPGDYDLVWEHTNVDLAAVDPLFTQPKYLAPPRDAQKKKYRGDLLPNVPEGSSGLLFVDYFQRDKNTGDPKGIVTLDPRLVP
jgi:hypothetical protein